MVARKDFHVGEKLSLRWRKPRRVIKALNDYVYQEEDLRNGDITGVHICRLKFYSDSSPDTKAIISHVLSSERGMPNSRLVKLVDSLDDLRVEFRYKSILVSEDTFQPIQGIYQDVPRMLLRLVGRRKLQSSLLIKPEAPLSERGECSTLRYPAVRYKYVFKIRSLQIFM